MTCCEGINDGTCYDWRDEKCCDGRGNTCPEDKNCCDAACCDPCEPANEKCCDDKGGNDDGYCCPSDNECCQGNCCDPDENCCDDTCYDTATHGCCDNLTLYDISTEKCCNEGTGHTCEKSPVNKICCDGNCCEPYECCIDGQCVDPICDNCHSVISTLYECGHNATDPNGAPCATNWCIENHLVSATCDYKGPDWPCPKSRCNTTPVEPWACEVYQIFRAGPCSGGTVEWVTWKKLYYGCYSCLLNHSFKSCETTGCGGTYTGQDLRGTKKKCGCDY